MSEDLLDPRGLLLSKVDLLNSRIEFSAIPIVLLCGGKVKIKERPDDPEPQIASLRHAITKNFPSGYELFRPEEITDWHSDGMFRDLMSFEAELANVCSLVVIILESVGSYAELGAFSQLPQLRKRLIAVQSNEYVNEASFVNLGILRHIKANHESSIKSYPWTIANPASISPDVVADLISDIQDELNGLQKSQVIKTNQGSHAVAIICGIIELFIAVKEHEILDYLEKFGFEMAKDSLKRKLFLLEKFRLIERHRYSDSDFYFRSSGRYHKLRLVLHEEAHLDQLRVKAACFEFYKSSRKHRNHVRVITEVRGGKK